MAGKIVFRPCRGGERVFAAETTELEYLGLGDCPVCGMRVPVIRREFSEQKIFRGNMMHFRPYRAIRKPVEYPDD